MATITALAERRENRAVAARPLIVKETLDSEAEQRKLLGEYVKSQMEEGPDKDYGIIPGTKKRSLLKPGAEKLCSLFRCTPRFEVDKETEDWSKPFFYYRFRCYVESNDTGAVVAEGFGSANSMEDKWRWRQANRKCPACGKEAIIKGKAEYGGGWLCFKKKDGCGAKWPDGAPEIESQEAGRIENPDVASQTNTILKIAKKRALVDAAIALARCSDLFTQDIEDVGAPPADTSEPPAQQPPKQQEKPAQPSGSGAHPASIMKELNAGIPELAKLRGATPAAIAAKLLEHVNDHFQVKRKSAADCTTEELEFAANSIQLSLAKAREQAQARADQKTTEPQPAPERQPGEDPPDGGDGETDTHETGNPVGQTPPVDAARRILADQTIAVLHQCGTDWNTAIEESPKIIGRQLPRGAHAAECSHEELLCIRSWAKKRKAGMDAVKRHQPAGAA
jgi:hypothetical protein